MIKKLLFYGFSLVLLIAFFAAILLSLGWLRLLPKHEIDLARQIIANSDLNRARAKMTDVLRGGLSAGGIIKRCGLGI